jgi:hypothetical protein
MARGELPAWSSERQTGVRERSVMSSREWTSIVCTVFYPDYLIILRNRASATCLPWERASEEPAAEADMCYSIRSTLDDPSDTKKLQLYSVLARTTLVEKPRKSPAIAWIALH